MYSTAASSLATRASMSSLSPPPPPLSIDSLPVGALGNLPHTVLSLCFIFFRLLVSHPFLEHVVIELSVSPARPANYFKQRAPFQHWPHAASWIDFSHHRRKNRDGFTAYIANDSRVCLATRRTLQRDPFGAEVLSAVTKRDGLVELLHTIRGLIHSFS